jgi:hypothetical protein
VIDENDTRLPKARLITTRLSRESDPSFTSWETALAHVNGPPLPPGSLLMPDRAMMDVLLDMPIQSERSGFTFTPRFGRLGVRVTTTLSFLQPDGGIRLFEYEGDPEPFRLNPTWDQSAAHFIQLGFSHILSETDHLWFLLCLVLLFRRVRMLAPFVIAFTAAHSFALVGSAFGLAPAFPWLAALAGTLMALSVVYMALECIVGGAASNSRLPVAVASGIFFGSGFWFFLLPVLQFGGEHRLVSVLAFNVGIEMGQFLALALMIPLSAIFFRFVVAERIGTMILAGLTAHAAWHRMTDRAFMLGSPTMQWPAFANFDVRYVVLAVAVAIILLALKQRAPRPT